MIGDFLYAAAATAGGEEQGYLVRIRNWLGFWWGIESQPDRDRYKYLSFFFQILDLEARKKLMVWIYKILKGKTVIRN